MLDARDLIRRRWGDSVNSLTVTLRIPEYWSIKFKVAHFPLGILKVAASDYVHVEHVRIQIWNPQPSWWTTASHNIGRACYKTWLCLICNLNVGLCKCVKHSAFLEIWTLFKQLVELFPVYLNMIIKNWRLSHLSVLITGITLYCNSWGVMQ